MNEPKMPSSNQNRDVSRQGFNAKSRGKSLSVTRLEKEVGSCQGNLCQGRQSEGMVANDRRIRTVSNNNSSIGKFNLPTISTVTSIKLMLSLATTSFVVSYASPSVNAALEDSPKTVVDEVWQIVNNEFVDQNSTK